MASRKSNAAILFFALALILATVVAAHEGGKHFMGNVKSIDAASLTIITTTHETVTLKLLPTTKFMKSHQPSSLQELKAGERVVVHAKQDGKSWDAEEVQFGASSAKR